MVISPAMNPEFRVKICVRKVQLEHIVQIIEGWSEILFAVPLFSGQVLQIIVTAHEVREQFDFHKKMFLEGFLSREPPENGFLTLYLI